MTQQFSPSKPIVRDTWLSNYRNQYNTLNAPATVVDLDEQARLLVDKKATQSLDSQQINASSVFKKERDFETLFFLPETILTQVYHSIGNQRAHMSTQLADTIAYRLKNRGVSEREKDSLLSTISAEPHRTKLAIEQRIKDQEAGNFGYYQGKVIERPTYFRMCERFNLNIPTLNSIASLHRQHAPVSDNYSFFDVGAWDGGLSASMKHLYDSIDMLEPDGKRFDQLEERAQWLQSERGYHGKSLLVNPIQARIDEYLELHMGESQRGYDSILMSHVLYFLPFELGESVLKNLAQQLRTGGILITVLNSYDNDSGSRSHLRSLTKEHEQLVEPSYIERYLSNIGLEVVNLERELRLSCATDLGRQALKDIITFLIPGKARLDTGLADRYIEKYCLQSDGSTYQFSHKANFLVAIQPDGAARNAFASFFNARTEYQPEEVSLAETSIDFSALMARLGMAADSNQETSLVIQVDRGAQQALELYESKTPFTIDTLSSDERISFVAGLYRKYIKNAFAENMTLDPQSVSNNLRVACALAISAVDFTSSEMTTQFEALVQKSYSWQIGLNNDYKWLEIARSRIDNTLISNFLERLDTTAVQNHPQSNSIYEMNWDSRWTELAKKAADYDIQKFADNAANFKELDKVRERITDQLLSLWPVQKSLFRIILSPDDSNQILDLSGTSNEGMWFKEVHTHWKLISEQVYEAARYTQFNLLEWSRDPSDIISYQRFQQQLTANQQFLRNINIPMAYYLALTDRLEKNLITLKGNKNNETLLARQNSVLLRFGLPVDKLVDSLEGISELRAKLVACRSIILDQNLPLVIGFVMKHFSKFKETDRDDFIQEAQVGMCRAIELFDLSRGLQFGTYATWWIRQSITRFINNGGLSLTRIPVHYEEYRSQLNKLRQEIQRIPSAEEEIAHLMSANEFDRDKAEFYHKIVRRKFISTDKSVSKDSEFTYGDAHLTFDNRLESSIKEKRDEIRALLGPALDTLNRRERLVISLRFGLAYQDRHGENRDFVNDDQQENGKTLEAAAGLLCVTRERVRQIEASALEKLRDSNALPIERLRQYALGQIDIVKADTQAGGLSTPLTELDLELRTVNTLANDDIHTLADLIEASETDLLAIANFGEVTVGQIKAVLSGLGLSLRQEEGDIE